MKFLLTNFPGLRRLLVEELSARLNLKADGDGRVRGSELLWVEVPNAVGLLGLRIAEDVFVAVDSLKLTGQNADLKAIGVLLGRPAGLTAALRVYTELTGAVVPARAQYRVVAQADDAAWRKYRRVDMQVMAEAGLSRARPGWRLNPDEAPIEIWLHLVGRTLYVSLRLTVASHRSRGGRTVERAAALRPTIAAAMVWAARPQNDDVFLDPMCGSGTILLERALYGRHGLLVGGDIDAAAVKAAQANFGPRHKPVRIERMDARALELETASVDKLVTNLPWGRQIGRPEEMPALYKGVLAEAARVVRPSGAVVVLTSEGRLLKSLAAAQAGIKLEKSYAGIEVLGRKAEIFVIKRL
ncbi:MAG: methyltransferase domain-containing protein [Candidatus Saccharimonadales bacterium]